MVVHDVGERVVLGFADPATRGPTILGMLDAIHCGAGIGMSLAGATMESGFVIS